MNGTSGGSAVEGNLPGFYSYKNTFSPDSVWLEIPKKGEHPFLIIGTAFSMIIVTFVDVTDPYAGDPLDDPPLTPPDTSISVPLRADCGPDATYRSRSSEVAAHGLEALSAAASRDTDAFLHSQASHHEMASTAISYMAQNLHQSPGSQSSARRYMQMANSPTTSVNLTNNINFLLNPQGSRSPPIDPSLRNPPEQREHSFTATALRPESRVEQPVESDQEVAYLLRHFAEAPGSW